MRKMILSLGLVLISQLALQAQTQTQQFSNDVFIPYGKSYWIGAIGDAGNRFRMHHSGSSGDAYIDFAPNLNFRAGTQHVVNFLQNGRVGIGTTSPNAQLEIKGNVNPNFLLSESAIRLEIGVASCTGCYASFARHGDVVFRPRGAAADGHQGLIFSLPTSLGNGLSYFQFGDEHNGGWFTLYNNKKVVIDANVGIGTTSPQNKLEVNGTIRAKEVKVETGWADFVFNDDYNLCPLSEVSNFIQENKHLPEIPTATEVKTEGVNLGEMQTKLLQKVEELTLYLIQQDNTIRELKAELQELKNK